MSTYKILSLDGGGLRGLITARMLQRLNDDPEILGWINKADLIAGTSTGGILALGLASGRTLAEICSLYKDKGPEIFDDNVFDNIFKLGKILGADYSNNNLKKELQSLFEATKLSDLKKKVAITAFDLDNENKDAKERTWKPKIFHNFNNDDSDGPNLAFDVALYTSAAPTYFPSVDGFIDGGVFASNPSMVAIAQAIDQRNSPEERARIDDIVLLSVGTGVSHAYIEEKTVDWGLAQWVTPLINILQDGVAGIADYQAMQLLGARYKRLDITFPKGEGIAMDAVDKINLMDEAGIHADISKAKQWIQTHWM